VPSTNCKRKKLTMQTIQQGDRVRVHFVKRSPVRRASTSRRKVPIEVTVGTEHRRLPGLGVSLVGLSEGAKVMLIVPPERAYGTRRRAKIRQLTRDWFADQNTLTPGAWVRVMGRTGRRRLVRILDVVDSTVTVDTNHPYASQPVMFEIEVLEINPRENLDG
jgi:FKBP-type peptidyl-prolyl cis-trans isomerase 2